MANSTQTIGAEGIEGLEDRLLALPSGLQTVQIDNENKPKYPVDYESGLYYVLDPEQPHKLMPAGAVELAYIITNALSDSYLQGLMERALKLAEAHDDEKLVMWGLMVSRAREGLIEISPASVVDMWIDNSGYHFVDRREQYQYEANFGWGARIEDVLPHAQALGKNRMYSTIFEEGRASRIAWQVQCNAAALEYRLSDAAQK